MNPETGHLVDTTNLEEEALLKLLARGYLPLPTELQPATRRTLKGKLEATISKTSGGKLASWARQKRKERRKIAKESRRKNRRK